MGKTKLVSAKKMGKQPTMGQKKTKEAIAKAASASKKGGKKKWSKGKVKDKLNNKVFMDEATDKAMRKDVTNMPLITISTLSEKYKIIGSLCRPLIKQFAAEGEIVPIGNQHSSLVLYTGTGYLAKKAGSA